MVVVKFMGLITDLIGKEELKLKIASNTTVQELIDNITKMYGEKLGKIIDSALIIVNGKGVINRRTLVLQKDDIVQVMSPFVGG